MIVSTDPLEKRLSDAYNFIIGGLLVEDIPEKLQHAFTELIGRLENIDQHDPSEICGRLLGFYSRLYQESALR